MKKSLFFEGDFPGYIKHIDFFNADDLLVLAQKGGVIVNSHTKRVEQTFDFPACGGPVPIIDGRELRIFCTGRAFSDVWLATEKGEVISQFPKEMGTTLTAAYDPLTGRYYVATWKGLHLVEEDQKIRRISDETITDIRFLHEGKPSHALTLSTQERFLRTRVRVDLRDREMNIISRFDVNKGAMQLVGVGWPQENSILYRTQSALHYIDQKGTETGRVSIGRRAINAHAVSVRVGNERFLALLVLYSPTVRAVSKLFILNSDFQTIHEEEMPHAEGLTVISRHGRETLLIGEEDRRIYEYNFEEQ